MLLIHEDQNFTIQMWGSAFLCGLTPPPRWVVRNLTCLSVGLCDCLQRAKPSFVPQSWDDRAREPRDPASAARGLSCAPAPAWPSHSPEQHDRSVTSTSQRHVDSSLQPASQLIHRHDNLRVPWEKERLRRGPCLKKLHCHGEGRAPCSGVKEQVLPLESRSMVRV